MRISLLFLFLGPVMGAVMDKAPLPQKDAKAPGVFDNRGFNKECGSPEGGYGASSMYDPGFKKSTCTVQCGWDPQAQRYSIVVGGYGCNDEKQRQKCRAIYSCS